MFRCVRPSLLGLEAHLAAMQELVEEFDPAVVVVDPISDLGAVGTDRNVSAMLTRQVDFLKGRGVTAMFTSLGPELGSQAVNHVVASLIDTWLHVSTLDGNGEHNRVLSVQKSRGMANSNQIREFLITDRGVELADVYVGPQGVLTGRHAPRKRRPSGGTRSSARRTSSTGGPASSANAKRWRLRSPWVWRAYETEADAVSRLLTRGTTGRQEGADQRLEQGRLRRGDAVGPEKKLADVDRRRPAMSSVELSPRLMRSGRSVGTCGCTSPVSLPSAGGVRESRDHL